MPMFGSKRPYHKVTNAVLSDLLPTTEPEEFPDLLITNEFKWDSWNSPRSPSSFESTNQKQNPPSTLVL